MGFFGKKKDDGTRGHAEESYEGAPLKDELQTKIEDLESEFGEKKAEYEQLEERVRTVKEEYDAAVSNLMAVKKELHHRKLEADVAQREHKSILEKIKELDRNKDEKREVEFIKTELELSKIKKELESLTEEHQKVKEDLTQRHSDLRMVRKQQIDVEKELEEANSRLYNAKTELDKKDEFQDPSILTPKEKEFIQGEKRNDQSIAGVIEAASAVVGSLKSKLNTAQKELDTVQNLLEKEREAHAETRNKLDNLKSSES